LDRIVFGNVERTGKIQAPTKRALTADDRTLDANVAKDRAKLNVADVLFLPSPIQTPIWGMFDILRIGIDRCVNLGARLLQTEVQLPILIQRHHIADQRTAGENGGVWPFIIYRVRPGVRVFKDAVGLAYDPVIDFTVKLADTKIERASTAAEEIILVIKARTAVDLRRTDVDAQLRTFRVDIELIAAAFEEVAFYWNLSGHETIRVSGVLGIVRDIDTRFGVKLDQHIRVRNRNESAILRIESQVVRPRRRLLLIVNGWTLRYFAGVAFKGDGPGSDRHHRIAIRVDQRRCGMRSFRRRSRRSPGSRNLLFLLLLLIFL